MLEVLLDETLVDVTGEGSVIILCGHGDAVDVDIHPCHVEGVGGLLVVVGVVDGAIDVVVVVICLDDVVDDDATAVPVEAAFDEAAQLEGDGVFGYFTRNTVRLVNNINVCSVGIRYPNTAMRTIERCNELSEREVHFRGLIFALLRYVGRQGFEPRSGLWETHSKTLSGHPSAPYCHPNYER